MPNDHSVKKMFMTKKAPLNGTVSSFTCIFGKYFQSFYRGFEIQ